MPENDEAWCLNGLVPGCLINLKEVKFGIMGGNKYELYLAKYVMENAFHLERFSFFHAKLVSIFVRNMEHFKKQLVSMEKGLNLTVIDFSDF